MSIASFLNKNLKWNFSKDRFADLCCAPVSEETLSDQLRRLSERYFPERRHIDTAFTEFALNEIALFSPKTAPQKCVKQHFDEVWRTFLRVKKVFRKPTATFPADGSATRLERIATLVAQCTQFAVDRQTLARISDKIFSIFDLEEKERRNLENAVLLLKTDYFCAVARGVFKGDKSAAIRLAKMLDSCKISEEFLPNNTLRHCIFCSEKLVSNINCLGTSATKFFDPTQIDVKHFFFAGGKNVFDTFCMSKMGNHTAEFLSESGTLRVKMQYFLQNTCEVRRYSVTNGGAATRKITTDFLFRHTNARNKTSYFPAEGALCLSVEGETEFYCALAIVKNNKILPCEFEDGRISYVFSMLPSQTIRFDLVTAFAENMPDLANMLQFLNCFGATRCPFLSDEPSKSIVRTDRPLRPTPHGFLPRESPKKTATTFNFTYQLGDEKGATFLDNDGNSTTLLDGFAFGVGGEKVFSEKCGRMNRLNCGKFSLCGSTATFRNAQSTCRTEHNDGKIYTLEHATKRRSVFFFPLEEKSEITVTEEGFGICGKLRNFTVKCLCGKIESYTADILECNDDRIRYRFSDDLSAGTCLAFCLEPSTFCKIKIENSRALPAPCPIVRECLLSTYLNYVNNKNVFCIANMLKRVDSLTLAAICYTNPHFVKDYAAHMFENRKFFYDVAGGKKEFFDKLALPLAMIYYANLVHDDSFPNSEQKKYAESILFKETFDGKELCVKALALKKAARVAGFDKVRCLVEYNNLKKRMTGDNKLYGYAQAIGAVPLCQPSKERLKDLCATYDLPKSWYYVSQLENLYGLTLAEGTLQFAPKVTQENILEELSLNVDGKRLDTVFLRSAVQSMTLNGVQYFVPLKTDSLKNAENKLEVRY